MLEYTLTPADLAAFAAWRSDEAGDADPRRRRMRVAGAWLAGSTAYVVVFAVSALPLLVNLELLLAQLADVPMAHRGAAFVCAAALVTPGGVEVVEHGAMRGTLALAPRGEHGFGYDPVLVPAGETRTCAELEPAQKNALSHRGQAFRALAPAVAAALA